MLWEWQTVNMQYRHYICMLLIVLLRHFDSKRSKNRLKIFSNLLLAVPGRCCRCGLLFLSLFVRFSVYRRLSVIAVEYSSCFISVWNLDLHVCCFDETKSFTRTEQLLKYVYELQQNLAETTYNDPPSFLWMFSLLLKDLISDFIFESYRVANLEDRFSRDLAPLCLAFLFHCRLMSSMGCEILWALSWENLSSGFPTRWDSNQAARLQKLARVLNFWM